MTDRLELIIESQALLGESPCWHQEKQLLYWVDILKKQLHVYQPTTNIDRTIELVVSQLINDRLFGRISSDAIALC